MKIDPILIEEEFHQTKERRGPKKTGKPAPSKKGDFKLGRVVSITKEGIFVDTREEPCLLKSSFKQKKNIKNPPAVGDIVEYDQSGIIHHIEPRYSELVREELLRKKKQILAVNIDFVLIVTTASSPALRPALIDRYIISAKKGNCKPMVIINKCDLPPSEPDVFAEFLAGLKQALVPYMETSCVTKKGLRKLKQLMAGKATVLSGQSGVGKSSLINALFDTELKVGALAKTNKGMHITSRSHMHIFKKGGFCIDTPGIRSFGLHELLKEDILLGFPEIAALALKCKFVKCTHQVEPGCAVQKALSEKKITALRFDSFSSLMKKKEGNYGKD